MNQKMVIIQFRQNKHKVNVVGEVPIRVCSLEGGATRGHEPKGVPEL
jgi:hypothetical protein